jgi:hypothetical protein
MLFLRHRMKADGSLPLGTINLAAEYFGRHRDKISQMYTELKQKYVNEPDIPKRQDIVLLSAHECGRITSYWYYCFDISASSSTFRSSLEHD